jgi:histidinol-phosphate aminotransferase
MACRLAGARLVKLHARENDDFSPRLEEITKLLRELRPRVVFIGNPNNPTGKYLSRDDIETILDNMKNSLLILDEAYVGFANARWNSLNLTKKNNVVILRSMTKEYGLPGLRLGYAVARREIIDSLCAVLPPWNTNIVAQEVGIAVLKQEEYLRQSLRKVKEAKRFLVAGLSRLGFKVLPSDTHYFLVKVGEATVVCRSLLKRRIFVRDGTSFGLPEYIRISPRIMPECVKLIEVFDGIIKSGENVI